MQSRPAPGQARGRSHEVCEQPGHGLHGHRLLAQAHRSKSTVFALDPCKCHFGGHFIIFIRIQRTQTSGTEKTRKTAVLLRTAPGRATWLWRADCAPSGCVTRRTLSRSYCRTVTEHRQDNGGHLQVPHLDPTSESLVQKHTIRTDSKSRAPWALTLAPTLQPTPTAWSQPHSPRGQARPSLAPLSPMALQLPTAGGREKHLARRARGRPRRRPQPPESRRAAPAPTVRSPPGAVGTGPTGARCRNVAPAGMDPRSSHTGVAATCGRTPKAHRHAAGRRKGRHPVQGTAATAHPTTLSLPPAQAPGRP